MGSLEFFCFLWDDRVSQTEGTVILIWVFPMLESKTELVSCGVRDKKQSNTSAKDFQRALVKLYTQVEEESLKQGELEES